MENLPKDDAEKDQEEEWIGPMPSEAKKRKVLNHEKLFLDK